MTCNHEIIHSISLHPNSDRGKNAKWCTWCGAISYNSDFPPEEWNSPSSLRKESQVSISNWAYSTFGESTSNRAAVRINEEVCELLKHLAQCESAKAAAELPDIAICLFRLASIIGIDLLEEIDKKMAVNRSRQWKLDGNGCGYHVQSEKQTEQCTGHLIHDQYTICPVHDK